MKTSSKLYDARPLGVLRTENETAYTDKITDVKYTLYREENELNVLDYDGQCLILARHSKMQRGLNLCPAENIKIVQEVSLSVNVF